MRKSILYLFLFLFAAAAACKKVISVDLNNATPQIVIEGEITNTKGPFQVKISKSVNFSANNVYPPVTNATVVVVDSTAGKQDQLTQTDSGIYKAYRITGTPKHTYSLVVTVDGKQYTAVSKMPLPVLLDSVTFALNYDLDGKQQINAVVNFKDPPGLGNYYQFTETVNRRKIPNVFVFEDRLSDGKYIEQPLFNDSAYLRRNDTLLVTMNCIDKNIYNYFFTLANITGNNSFQTSSPANPVSNISNGALGYFSAHTTQKVLIRVY